MGEKRRSEGFPPPVMASEWALLLESSFGVFWQSKLQLESGDFILPRDGDGMTNMYLRIRGTKGASLCSSHRSRLGANRRTFRTTVDEECWSWVSFGVPISVTLGLRLESTEPVYADMDMEDQDWVTVRLYLRAIRGEELAGDDAITLQEGLSKMGSEKLLELVQTVATRGSKAIVKRVEGQDLTPEEAWMADEMGEQLAWAWQKPENQEHRRETVKEALIATRKNAAESLAKGSEFADQFAELYIQSMRRLEEIEPDLAEEIEDEE